MSLFHKYSLILYYRNNAFIVLLFCKLRVIRNLLRMTIYTAVTRMSYNTPFTCVIDALSVFETNFCIYFSPSFCDWFLNLAIWFIGLPYSVTFHIKSITHKSLLQPIVGLVYRIKCTCMPATLILWHICILNCVYSRHCNVYSRCKRH